MADTITGNVKLIIDAQDKARAKIQLLTQALKKNLSPEEFKRVVDELEKMPQVSAKSAKEIEKLQDKLKGAETEAKNLGRANDRLGKSNDKLRDKTKKLGKEVDNLKKKNKQAGKSMDDLGDAADAMGGEVGGAVNSLGEIVAVAGRVHPALLAVAAALVTVTAGMKAAADTRNMAKELTFLSAQSNTSVTELQRIAFATSTMGFEMDKTADVLKDFNDKLGDAILTGQGGFAEFLNTVGRDLNLTAEQLAELPVSEAMIEVQEAMERANVPMEQQIFLWESIANDSSRLIPLLQQNGRQFRSLAADAEKLGAVFSEEELARSKELDETLREMEASFNRLWAEVGFIFIPVLDALATAATKTAQAISGMNNEFDKTVVPTSLDGFSRQMQSATQRAGELTNEIYRLQDADMTELQEMFKGVDGDLELLRDKSITALMNERDEVVKTLDELQAGRKKLLDDQATQRGEEGERLLGVTPEEIQKLVDKLGAEVTKLGKKTATSLDDQLAADKESILANYQDIYITLARYSKEQQDKVTPLLDQLIKAETAEEQFNTLRGVFDRGLADLQADTDEVGRKLMAGLIDEDQARDQLEQLNAVAATELDSFVAQMARLTEESGSRELQEQLVDLQNTAAAFKASLGTDGFVEPAWLANMDKLRESVRSLEFDLINTFESGNLDTIGVAMEAATQAAIAPLQRLKEQLAETFSGEDLETQVSIVDQMIDVKQAEAEFAVLEQLFNTKMDALRDVVELSDRDLGRGLITEAEAAERVKQAYAELEPEISRIAGKLQAIANESGVPELQRQVSDLKLGFENLSFEVDDATKTMVDGMLEAGDAALESGIKDFFTDIITETDSIQDAFRNLGVGILKAMQDVVTSALARQFMEMLSGSFGGGASGGGTGFFASIAGAFAGGFATGGYVRGQGTTTSDSIIARLSDKEFVQPADSVAYYGTEFMEMIRRKALPKSSAMNFGGVQVRTPTVARYSEGGFVSGSALQGTAPVSVDQGDVNVMVVRSEEEALSALRTSGGERAVLSIIKGNGSTISKYLGGA